MDELKTKYHYPWQIVEAFRYSLKKSVRRPNNTKWNEHYGAGILNLTALLKEQLPEAADLADAYSGIPEPKYKDPGIREAAHYIWNVVLRKIKPGSTESLSETALTERGKMAIEAYTKPSGKTGTESLMSGNTMATKLFLREFFT
jgi:hypothetical protein